MASVAKKIIEKRLQLNGHLSRREEWQMHGYQETVGYEVRNPGGKTCAIESPYGK